MHDIHKILNGIHQSKSLSEVKQIQNDNEKFILEVCFTIRCKIDNKPSIKNDVIKKIIPIKRFPEILFNYFEIDSVECNDNCFFRVTAELLLNDEEKYPVIKLFVIHHILSKLDYYEVFCKTSFINLYSENEESSLLVDPSVDDFMRMIAAYKIWGNESSIIAISHALEVKVVIFFCRWSTISTIINC